MKACLSRNAALMKLSAVSGIISGITWTIGDILLVGFKPDLANYPETPTRNSRPQCLRDLRTGLWLAR
ncbi:MAG: hypothetical protein LBU32_22335 [Clostridiales bacterium]|nr:hypothetical protein [Clostridiales bacterium]